MSAPKRYTAVDLIEKAILFARMTPNAALWKEGLLKESPPRYVRLRQINALATALFAPKPTNLLGKATHLFALGRVPTVKTLLSGGFLKARKTGAYEDFAALLKNTVREHEGTLGETGMLDYKQLTVVYLRLLQYKKQHLDLLHFNDEEPSPSPIGLRFCAYVTTAATSSLEGASAGVDEALALLVDPCRLSLTLEELQANYGYPKEDVSEVDRNYPR